MEKVTTYQEALEEIKNTKKLIRDTHALSSFVEKEHLSANSAIILIKNRLSQLLDIIKKQAETDENAKAALAEAENIVDILFYLDLPQSHIHLSEIQAARLAYSRKINGISDNTPNQPGSDQ